MRRWSKKSSATDLKLISCDRDNLTRSVWHSRCYHADTKSQARRYSPFKTVCFHMVTVPGWHKFQHVTWALPKRTYARALSPASTGLWIPAPGGQLFLSTHVWQSSRMKHGFVLALGLWTSSPCTDSIRFSAHWRLVLDSTLEAVTLHYIKWESSWFRMRWNGGHVRTILQKRSWSQMKLIFKAWKIARWKTYVHITVTNKFDLLCKISLKNVHVIKM